MKLVLSLFDTFSILTVNNEHKTLRASVIVPPKRTNFVLSTNIPNIELDILICYSFDVEANWTHEDRSMSWVEHAQQCRRTSGNGSHRLV